MRVTLPESDRVRSRSVGSTSVSVVLHAGLIGGVIAAGGLRAEPKTATVMPPPLIYVRTMTRPRLPPPSPTLRTPPSTPNVSKPNETPPIEKIDIPTIADPRTISSVLPPVDAVLGAIRETLPPPRFVPAGDSGSGSGQAGGLDHPLSAFAVDREVRVIGNVALRYPSMLQNAGISGEATMQYVVDTLGVVEKESIRVLSSTHQLFAQAARDALLRMRFSPAEVGHQKVRQLVEQRFGFEVK